MAKEIKAIKCPQCGSSSHTKLDTDHYKCSSCGTEYILDNSDINVNINHRNAGDQAKTPLKFIGIFALVIIGILFFGNFVSWIFKPAKPQYSTYERNQRTEVKKDPNKFTSRIQFSLILENTQSQVILFALTKREYPEADTKDKDGYYSVFTDFESGKILADSKLDIKDLKDKNSRLFVDNKNYLIINKKKLYEIRQDELLLQDITETLFSKRSEFASGIASLDFVYEPRGCGLQVMTNLGKEYYYYPIVDKVYMGDKVYDAGLGFASLLPGAKEVTYYEFTEKSTDFEDEAIQLLQIVYKSNNGGPEQKENSPRWFKDYGGSGIFTDRSPYTKRLFRKDRNRIVSYKDLTPDRIYFKAGVKCYDNQTLVIQYRPTVADDAPYILQALDPQTAAIKWTLNLEQGFNKIISTSNGYIGVVYNYQFVMITKDGKLGKEYKFQ